jgi:hypothetical protein
MNLTDQVPTPIPDCRLAYCAGYFDGEGCIWVGLMGGKPRYLRINIATGDYETLLVFTELFGGVVMPTKASSSQKNIFHWQRDSTDAVRVLSMLVPFLTAKREEAQLVIDYGWEPIERGMRLSHAQIAKRDALRLALKEIKKKNLKVSKSGIETLVSRKEHWEERTPILPFAPGGTDTT